METIAVCLLGRPDGHHIQHEVERRAYELIDSTLKPRYIQPPPKKAEVNYLVDLYAKWRGAFFYFIQATVRQDRVPCRLSSSQGSPDFSMPDLSAMLCFGSPAFAACVSSSRLRTNRSRLAARHALSSLSYPFRPTPLAGCVPVGILGLCGG